MHKASGPKQVWDTMREGRKEAGSSSPFCRGRNGPSNGVLLRILSELGLFLGRKKKTGE